MAALYKRVLLFTIIACLALGCSSDSDDELNTNLLVGEWIGESITYSGELETSLQGITVTADLDGEGYDIDYTINFNEELSYLTVNGDFSMEITISALGQSETFNEENLEINNDGDITVDGDQIIFEDEVVGTIISLTKNYLELNFDVEEEIEIDGTTYTTMLNSTLTFTK